MQRLTRARLATVAALAFGAADLAYINVVLAPRLGRASSARAEPVMPAPEPSSGPAPVRAAVRAEPVRAPTATKRARATSPPALGPVHFARGSTVLDPEARPVIAAAARAMRDDSRLRLLVKGHADPSGSDSVNLDLSWGRATSVVQALTAMGIEARRVRAVGRGSLEPVVPNRSAEDMAKNRRAEFVWQE